MKQVLHEVWDWFANLKIDWNLIGWAFAGATITTLRSRRRNWLESVLMVASGTLTSMVISPMAEQYWNVNPNAAAFLTGLVAWSVTGWLLEKAKDPLNAYREINSTTTHTDEEEEHDDAT